MKEGWEYKTLGSITTLMADGPFGSNLKKEHYTNERQVRIIQLSNIGENGWREDNKKYTTFKHLETIKRSQVEAGDIVIAKMMPAGRAIICPNNEQAYVLSSDAVKAVLKKEGISNTFILYQINSPFFRRQVYENVSGSGRVRTSLTKLRDCILQVPPLSEQLSTVDYLNTAFAKIDALKVNAEKQLNDARALFQAELKEMLEPKEGWEEKTIEHFAKIVHGKNQKDVVDVNGLYPIYGSGGNIMGYANSYLCDEGTTILGRKGTIDNPLFIDEKFWNVDTAFGIVAKDNCNKKFLYYSIKNVDWAKRNTGTTLPSLTQNVVYNVEMCVPPLSEQQQIVAHLDALSAKVKELEKINEQTQKECDALKQAMLREIFE